MLECMAVTILTRLENRYPIARHEHVAILYRGRSKAFRFASFLAEGLNRGELCHYLAPASFQNQMLDELRSQVADVEECWQSDRLTFSPGCVDFAELREHLRQAFAHAERKRAPALRWLEEAEWTTAAGFPLHRFFEFHSILNYQVKHYSSAALCQYDLDTIEPLHLFSTIAVHRHLLVEDAYVRDNPFYIPPEKFLPLSLEERERDLAGVFRDVGFDVRKLLDALVGYGTLRGGRLS
jgi:MEDS: MEthanogen/methylotroph, DcmR Sensory domain